MEKAIRVRFAPSPTGYLHIGGARTALFNFLFARRYGGRFLLRIEDTDIARSRGEMTEAILRSLSWLGLSWDEDPVYQATRMKRHAEVCTELVDRKAAYRCFCSADELQKKRDEAQKDGREYRYDRKCLALHPDEIRSNLESGIPFTVRLRVPEGETTFPDTIRGVVTIQNREIDDLILLRSDGTPVYQVAVVVDDHDMQITHVIRGDDHLSNTPKQIMIYKAMEWEIPEFAHVPMILGPDKKRLSKRHGAASVEAFREQGFLPEVVVNFLALLGWNPGDDREIMTLDEMVEAFSLIRISKNPAVFDETKLTWMNGQYIQRMDDGELLKKVSEELIQRGWITQEQGDTERPKLLKIVQLLKERVRRIDEFAEKSRYFFLDPDAYEEKAVRKHWMKEGVRERIARIREKMGQLETWTEEQLEQMVREMADEEGIDSGQFIHPVRLAVTGVSAGPGLFALLEVLGGETVLRRLGKALNCWPDSVSEKGM